jgi:hypothetical protein
VATTAGDGTEVRGNKARQMYPIARSIASCNVFSVRISWPALKLNNNYPQNDHETKSMAFLVAQASNLCAVAGLLQK